MNILISTESEDEVAEKFEKAAIIGSCSLFILIPIFLIIIIRKYKSNKKQVKNITIHPHLLLLLHKLIIMQCSFNKKMFQIYSKTHATLPS